MISLVGSATGIIATWAALYVSLTGLGLATHHWSTGSRPRGIGDSAWVGYACVLLALQLWHLFLPLGALATVLVVGGGGAAALAYRDAWTGKMWTPGGGARLVAGIVIAWIAVRALGEMTLFDSGMYHVPFVNWAKAYPIVPGLANLHGRLGFNPASLLFAAMVDVGPWVNGSQHVVNGFLVALYALQALRNAATLRPDAPASPRALFELAMLPGVLVAAMRQDVRSLSTDLPAFVLLAVAGGMLFDLLLTHDHASSASSGRLVALLATLAAAVCVKLSAAPFALGGTVVALLSERTSLSGPGLRRALVLPTGLMAAWLTRGAILTGYPLYPSRLISLPVDWRVNAEQADAESAWITMSARNLNTNTLEGSSTWIRHWWTLVLTRGDLFAHVLAPLALCAVGTILLLARRRKEGVPWRRAGWMLIPVVIALTVWWLSAPHTRMAQAPFWILAATVVACALGGAPVLTARGRTIVRAGSAAVFAILAGRTALGDWRRAKRGEGGRALVVALAAQPAGDGWLAAMPEPDLLRYLTPSGVDLAVPRVDNSCWNGPLLCTPHPTPHLEMRRPGDPARGFRLVGAWEPLWFPNPWIPFLPYWRCLRNGDLPAGRAATEAECRRAAEAPAPTSPQ